MRNINVQVYTYKNDIIASVKVDPFSTIVEFSGNLGFVEDRVPTVATCFNEGDWRKTYGDMYLDVLERKDKDAVFKALREIKGEKFDRELFNQVWDSMVKYGLLGIEN